MSHTFLTPNLTKNSNGKCRKLLIRDSHSPCYKVFLSVNLNHPKSEAGLLHEVIIIKDFYNMMSCLAHILFMMRITSSRTHYFTRAMSL